jgi:acylpyruvate hydrolase
MKYVTFIRGGQARLGALSGGDVIDLHRACREALDGLGDGNCSPGTHVTIPLELMDLLQGGETALRLAERTVELAAGNSARLAASDLWSSSTAVELQPPIRRPGKLICVGLNYRSHLAELGESPPEFPILFTKVATALIGHGQAIVLPRVSRQVDYEGELAVVIGRRGKYIPEREALSYVAGYMCANDVSAHDIEFRTSQWTSGKILDTFCPLGPALVTSDELPAPDSLRLRTVLNGETVQDACTSDMVFPVPALISYISSLTTLEPGDVILTGTPAGVGCNQEPQRFLRPGDEISVQIDGIGTLVNHVVSESRS